MIGFPVTLCLPGFMLRRFLAPDIPGFVVLRSYSVGFLALLLLNLWLKTWFAHDAEKGTRRSGGITEACAHCGLPNNAKDEHDQS